MSKNHKQRMKPLVVVAVYPTEFKLFCLSLPLPPQPCGFSIPLHLTEQKAAVRSHETPSTPSCQ